MAAAAEGAVHIHPVRPDIQTVDRLIQQNRLVAEFLAHSEKFSSAVGMALPGDSACSIWARQPSMLHSSKYPP